MMKNITINQTEDSEQWTFPNLAVSATLNITFSIWTSVGNGLVCAAYYKYQHLRTPFNALLVSMAYCSLLMVLSAALMLVGDITYPNGSSICTASGSLGLVVNGMLMYHLCAISVYRLLTVKYSLRYHAILTSNRVRTTILVIWLFGVLECVFIAVVIFEVDLVAYMEEKRHTCQSYWSVALKKVCSNSIAKRTATVLFIVLNIIPFCVMISCYFYIWRQSCRHSKNINAQRKAVDPQKTNDYTEHLRSTKTFAMVVGAFVVSYFPVLFAVCLEVIFQVHVNSLVMAAFAYLCESSSFWSPLIYAWRDAKFRKAFKMIGQGIFKCDQTQMEPEWIQKTKKNIYDNAQRFGERSIEAISLRQVNNRHS